MADQLFFHEVIDQAHLCGCLKDRYEGAETMADLHHLPDNTFKLIFDQGELMRHGQISDADLQWAANRGMDVTEARWFLVCGHCALQRPAHREIVDRMKRVATERAERAQASIDELRARMDDGEDMSFCGGCDMVVDELVPVRECTAPSCSLCDDPFDATDGRNCPDCNRPFTRKVCDAGCPECLSDEDIRQANLSDLENE